ncbi:stalk domain-containing protein, partial [Acinetobacter baumannii]|uniref:stalk domain-containing protein n=1 Tax=Acinetobacter baumannii TaxID=470 RepID=UPI002B23A360
DAAGQGIRVEVNGQEVSFPDAQPYMEDSRVLIPVRFVSEALGADVKYGNRTVVIEHNGQVISLKVNTRTVNVNGKQITLDVPARIKQERTFVPLRFVSEALEAQVHWDSAKKLVSITTKGHGQEPTPTTPEAFKWGKYTDLGAALFKSNASIQEGKLTLTVPSGSKAVWYTKGNGNGQELKAGDQFSQQLGKDQGYLMITKIYPGKDYVEGYAIYLDTQDAMLGGKYGGSNDGVVTTTLVINNQMVETTATLADVISAAQSLK